MTGMLEIRGSGRSWQLLEGRRVLAEADSFDKIGMKQDRILRARATATRPCMCCSAPFQSTGRHHRLCRLCREMG